MSSAPEPFWSALTLNEMSPSQWESLCDGCGKCCLHKLECEDSGEVYYTDVACRNLDCEAGGCSDYPNRIESVPECLVLKPQDVERFHWLPASCAYRLIHEGKPLAAWHPLISGDHDSVLRAGMSVRGRAVSETTVAEEDFENHVIHWVE